MDKDVAIKVENISKKFRIPHEKITSVRGAFVNIFKKNSFEEFEALKDISFEIKKGEFFGIIGRNGSGKSTLLKVLAGIYETDEGKIKIDGRISPFLELGIGFNPELSGRDNIYLNATILGLSKNQIEKKFDEIVAFSELERFIDQKIKNYSSGMSVRLAFSVAIHARRDILLMDEVLAVGDLNFQNKCLEEFNKYKAAGKTVILVSHSIETVQKYCDRAMLLRNGRIVKIGKADEVGNEYICENISDEEKRVRENEKQKLIQAEEKLNKLKGKDLEAEKRRIELEKMKQEEESENKVAEITKVEFLDKHEKEKNVFETGDDVLMRIYFKQNKKVEKLNFGIGLHTQENICILGVDTIMDKIDTSEYVEKKYFQLNLKDIPLKANSYFINIAIYGERDNIIYDHALKRKYFKIISRDGKYGMLDMDYQWN